MDDAIRAQLAALSVRKAVAENQGAVIIAAEVTDEMNAIFDRMLTAQPELCRDHVGEEE